MSIIDLDLNLSIIERKIEKHHERLERIERAILELADVHLTLLESRIEKLQDQNERIMKELTLRDAHGPD